MRLFRSTPLTMFSTVALAIALLGAAVMPSSAQSEFREVFAPFCTATPCFVAVGELEVEFEAYGG